MFGDNGVYFARGEIQKADREFSLVDFGFFELVREGGKCGFKDNYNKIFGFDFWKHWLKVDVRAKRWLFENFEYGNRQRCANFAYDFKSYFAFHVNEEPGIKRYFRQIGRADSGRWKAKFLRIKAKN